MLSIKRCHEDYNAISNKPIIIILNFQHDILPLKDKLFRMALRITMHHEEAEDVVQEVMIKMWNQRERLAEIESLEAYAMTLCRNQALDSQRKKSRRVLITDAPEAENAPKENPYDRIYAQDELRSVHRIMSLLPEKQRLCMHLRDFEGRNYNEIAEIMQISSDQVRINIFRARKFVKEHIEAARTS